MATHEEVPTLLLLAGEGGEVPETSYTISSAEAEVISTAVSMAELKPIIMSVENSVATETQVEEVPETVLASHLVAEKPSIRQTRGQQTKEIYQDSESGVTYEIVRGGTRRGGDKLIDSLGFTYNLKQGKGSKNVTYWWCSVRNSRLRCPAAVIQRNGVFMRGKRKHEHLFGQSTPKNESQFTRKPVIHRSQVKTEPSTPYRGGYTNKVTKMKSSDGRDYQLIIGGSKAGMDLLKDSMGYTYTLKKATVDGYKKHWRCSVRNKHLRCFASVVQQGKNFTCGPTEHSHLPGYNKPLNANETLPTPKPSKSDGATSMYADDGEEQVYGRSSDNYLTYSYASAKQKSRIARERKKKEHPTFLGPSCTINLTKCDDVDCNCRLVHCPFCDVHHFKPAKAGRVQDHLEMTHFAHGVQYDDLMIVKCFQDCSLERDFGHYHCVFCFQQIIKRNAYARHLLRHMRRMGIPDRLLVLPDSKFPDVINAYGFEIPICKKTTCDHVVQDRHYHCPQCQCVCRERSLTVNHLWRCLQRAQNDPSDPLSDDPDDEMVSVIDDSLLQLHLSHVKSFKDIPVHKCMVEGCCNGKYHCPMCPKPIFMPTYRQHLIAHYVTHWKQRVIYKGYGVLKCFHFCDGIDRTMCKTRYHFHCPICSKIILTKASFEDHLKTCHMFRFGENLIEEEAQDVDNRMEEELNICQESGPLTENVEFMEDRLTAQAIAMDAKKQLEKELQKSDRSIFRGVRRKSKAIDAILNTTIAEMKKEISDVIGDPYDNGAGGDEAEDVERPRDRSGSRRGQKASQNKRGSLEDEGVSAISIDESEIFDLCSAIISDKMVQALKSPTAMKSVLAKISGLTNTKVTMVKNGTQYLLSGVLEDLMEAKILLAKAFDKEPDKKTKVSQGTPVQTARAKMLKGRGAPKTCPEPKSESNTKSSSKLKVALKKGKASKKSDGTDDRFPYSEIKQIIEASKDSPSPKRGRGRPPKKSPASAKATPAEQSKASKKAAETPATPSTPQGRYSTRGIRKNYLEMNSGMTTIKKEPVSEDEAESENVEESEEEEEEEEEVDTTPRTRSRVTVTAKRKRSESPRKPVKKRKDSHEKEMEDESVDEVEAEEFEIEEIMDEEEDDDNDQFFDDSEQELDELDDEEEEDEENDEGEEDEEENVEVRPASDQKITDSTVNSLKTTNVSTSVPAVFKLGMRKVKMSKRKPKDQLDDGTDDEADKELDVSSDPVKLKCSLCEDFVADTFADLTSHLVTFHHVYDPPRCDLCQRDFDNSNSLKLHIERRHGPKTEPKTWKCTEEGCGKEFTSQNGLNGHVNRVHLGMANVQREKRYICSKCSYECNSAEDIFEHKRVAHDEPIKCQECSKYFMNYPSLKSHMSLKHWKSGSVTCDICYKQVSHPRYLQKHKEIHFPPKYCCYICQKKVMSNASLKAHLETHKPESERSYKFVCSYCGKPFALKANYEDHLNKHTGARPHRCDICQRGFSFRSMLMKHKKFVHSNERPYKCGICMKDFKFMNLLQNHMVTHTNKSKHICPTCSKCFTTASTLKFHQRKCKGAGWNKTQFMQPQMANTLILYTNPPASGAKMAANVLQDHASMVAVDTSPVETTQQMGYGSMETINQQAEMDVLKVLEGGASTEETVVMDGIHGMSNTLEVPVASSEEVLGTTSTGGEMEVYACSECNSTFGTYKEAEQHVLTAHTAHQISMETDTVQMPM